MLCVHRRLRDGRPYVVRPIRPEDKALLADGLARTSAQSIHRRFLGPKPRFTAAELRYLTEVDGDAHVAMVAVLADDPAGLIGVGRWVRDAADPTSAEVAIIVADELQGQGLGTELGLVLADAAGLRGVRRFTATMLAENRAAQALFARISARLDTRFDGAYHEIVAELPRRPAAPALESAA
jgi:RimJ/RimL family protein N-acetyltransferase